MTRKYAELREQHRFRLVCEEVKATFSQREQSSAPVLLWYLSNESVSGQRRRQ